MNPFIKPGAIVRYIGAHGIRGTESIVRRVIGFDSRYIAFEGYEGLFHARNFKPVVRVKMGRYSGTLEDMRQEP